MAWQSSSSSMSCRPFATSQTVSSSCIMERRSPTVRSPTFFPMIGLLRTISGRYTDVSGNTGTNTLEALVRTAQDECVQREAPLDEDEQQERLHDKRQ